MMLSYDAERAARLLLDAFVGINNDLLNKRAMLLVECLRDSIANDENALPKRGQFLREVHLFDATFNFVLSQQRDMLETFVLAYTKDEDL